MSTTPIDRLIDSCEDNPSLYMFSCGLCSKKTFAPLKREVEADREAHKTETGHDVSFLRWPMKGRRKAKP